MGIAIWGAVKEVAMNFWHWLFRRKHKEKYEDDRYDEARIKVAAECMKRGKMVTGKIYEDGSFEIDEEKP